MKYIPAAGASAGAALIEVVISVLLIAVAISATMSTLLATAGQSGQGQDREQVTLCMGQLLQGLKNYVTADASDASSAPGGSWTYPGDQCKGCWALAPGIHTVTPPASCPGTKLQYTVSAGPVSPSGLQASQVTATITWTPKP